MGLAPKSEKIYVVIIFNTTVLSMRVSESPYIAIRASVLVGRAPKSEKLYVFKVHYYYSAQIALSAVNTGLVP